MERVAALVFLGIAVVSVVGCEVLAWRECLETNSFFYCARILG